MCDEIIDANCIDMIPLPQCIHLIRSPGEGLFRVAVTAVRRRFPGPFIVLGQVRAG